MKGTATEHSKPQGMRVQVVPPGKEVWAKENRNYGISNERRRPDVRTNYRSTDFSSSGHCPFACLFVFFFFN